MAIARWVIFLTLLATVALFAMYAVTGKAHFRRYGLLVLRSSLLLALVFFAVLILQRI